MHSKHSIQGVQIFARNNSSLQKMEFIEKKIGLKYNFKLFPKSEDIANILFTLTQFRIMYHEL